MTGHPSPVDRTSYLGRRDARSIERDSASLANSDTMYAAPISLRLAADPFVYFTINR